MSVRQVVVGGLLIGGATLELLAVIGVAVMRDVYDRLHYVGLAGFGALLVAGAIVVQESFSLIGDKSLATAGVLVLFGPVLVHTTARSLRVREHGDWRTDRKRRDEDAGRRTAGDSASGEEAPP